MQSPTQQPYEVVPDLKLTECLHDVMNTTLTTAMFCQGMWRSMMTSQATCGLGTIAELVIVFHAQYRYQTPNTTELWAIRQYTATRLASDGGSEGVGTREITPGPILALIDPPDQCFGLRQPRSDYPRSPRILASEASMYAGSGDQDMAVSVQ